ncbi:glycosyltransferase family 4 protein [Acidithiobacillus ferriphilus]|uniref:glycosyltransferase family 4 protein n=1 Tax=Acidithiobacillus ferriphilus TaxID=1689834 RepID=UPI002DBFE9DA|nr:glycosyltransferase family 1 protein [Acidithiobacillus ferriphilus]MEB8537202.1 glycosyltransferase family 1 protein [Acidithiobacillus ferriphilus]
MSGFGDAPIFLDVTRLLYRLTRGRMPTGVDRVCLAYVRHFHHRAQAMVIWGGIAVGWSPSASMALFDRLMGWEDGERLASLGNTLRAALKWPPRAVPAGSWVLNMGHSGLDQRSYLGWLRRKNMRLLVMVHDLIPITHPQFCQAGAAKRHVRRMGLILGQAEGIVSNSRHTAEMLGEHARQTGVAVPPVAVIPLGAKKHRTVCEDEPGAVTEPYFVMVGTLEPRKNHAFVLRLWQRMLDEWHAAEIPHLLVIGQIGWMCGPVVHQLKADERMKQRVHLMTDCDDARLGHYLRHARAMLFPSHAEGYGLPLLEAMDLGVPVLTSPLPVFREVAGLVPDYLDLDDGDAWLEAIRDYAQPASARREAQLQRLRGFSAPSWSDHFSEFETFVSRL